MRDIAIKEAVLAAKLFLIRAKAFSDATRNSDGSYEYQGGNGSDVSICTPRVGCVAPGLA